MLVACSGGSDSVALAIVLQSIAKPNEWRLTLAHVNHGLRHSAWQDEAVVLRAAAALRLPLKVAALGGASRDEASLRELRYAALARLAEGCGARVVATGHTASDQTETVLLALFRGTGPRGIAGMPVRRPLSPAVDLVRPLLAADRRALRAYVLRAGLPFAVDPTNADRTMRRNAVRAALEALRPSFPGLDAAVARAAGLVAAEAGHVPAAAVRRQVRAALQEHEALDGVDFEHVEAAVRTLQRGGSGRFSMGSGVEVAIVKGALTVHRRR